jgi:hypothetical protein
LTAGYETAMSARRSSGMWNETRSKPAYVNPLKTGNGRVPVNATKVAFPVISWTPAAWSGAGRLGGWAVRHAFSAISLQGAGCTQTANLARTLWNCRTRRISRAALLGSVAAKELYDAESPVGRQDAHTRPFDRARRTIPCAQYGLRSQGRSPGPAATLCAPRAFPPRMLVPSAR